MKKVRFFLIFLYFRLYYKWEFYFFIPKLMKNKILSYLSRWVFVVLLGFWWLWLNSVEAATCGQGCENWIKLNTCFPVIWDCIEVSQWASLYAFPNMVSALTKFIMALILVVCFILVIYAGILWASDNPKDAKKWLQRVAVTILLLWFSWAILRLINPNFFS